MLYENDDYILIPSDENDYPDIAEIYNSNRMFLINHMNKFVVDNIFVEDEKHQMSKIGFSQIKIIDKKKKNIIGFFDYKLENETYLSLFMIHGRLKGKGYGKIIYNLFEEYLIEQASEKIRIDVVFDYKENVVEFWKKLNYEIVEEIELKWCEKKSKAYKMIKRLI